MIEIDGSFGEGGGQILRTSLTLSALTGKPFRIYNIRAKRPKPGLQMQHLTAVRVVKQLCRAEVKGDYLGSLNLEFKPNKIVESGEFTFDVTTAGSVTLIIQTILPLLINRNIIVRIKGGTDVPKSPTIDYIRLVFLDILNKIGLKANINLIKRGHYPEGGGEVLIKDVRGSLERFEILEFGNLKKVIGISHVSSLPRHIAERQAISAKDYVTKNFNVEVMIDIDERRGEISKGSGIALAGIGDNSTIGSDALGEKGKRAEDVGLEAARALVEDLKSGGAVDRHMSDMLMIYASLVGGSYSGAELTSHASTNIYVIKSFLNVDINVINKKPFLFKSSKPKENILL